MSRTTNYFWEVDGCELQAHVTFMNDLDAQLHAVAGGGLTITQVKADTQIASAISLKHTAGTDVYAASAITNTPAGNISSITVQAAINELDTEKTTLALVKADTDVASAISLKHTAGTDTYAASAITNTPAGDIAAITVQAAINELDSEKTTLTAVKTALIPHTTTLVGGTITVADSAILSSNLLMYCRSTAGGTLGNLSYVINNGVSIVFTSDNVADTSTINYTIF